MGYACYFDVLYLTFKLSIANCCHVEIHTRLCAFVRGIIIKIGLLNHCTKGDRDGGQRNGPTVSKVLDITRLYSVAIKFKRISEYKKTTTVYTANRNRVHDNSFTSTTVTNCSDLPGENKLCVVLS